MAMPLDQKKALKDFAIKFNDKLTKIKVCIFDVDGILTDGGITWNGEDLGFNRTTHAQDGWAMKFLMKKGIKVGIISGGDGPCLRKRFVDLLKLDFVFLGNEDKREAYKSILGMGYSDEEVLYMGDEFIDIPLLKRAGFSATVPNASFEIQEICDYITFRESGDACVREVIDMLRYAQNLEVEIPEF
jgi:3-deoxy-D-manno-octulosonate 8-phosphate phosphatase (KDO 8-P phosphatase)